MMLARVLEDSCELNRRTSWQACRCRIKVWARAHSRVSMCTALFNAHGGGHIVLHDP